MVLSSLFFFFLLVILFIYGVRKLVCYSSLIKALNENLIFMVWPLDSLCRIVIPIFYWVRNQKRIQAVTLFFSPISLYWHQSINQSCCTDYRADQLFEIWTGEVLCLLLPHGWSCRTKAIALYVSVSVIQKDLDILLHIFLL